MLEPFTRPEIAQLEAYEWEMSNKQIADAMGLQESQIIRFDVNTTPYTLRTILTDLATNLPNFPVNAYPDTFYADLAKLVADYTQTTKDMIVIGSGADECLDIVAKVFLERGTNAILPSPTYAMFQVVTELMAAQPMKIPRQADFSVDMNAVLETINSKTRLIFLCSPNNPTATTTPRKDIEYLLEQTNCPILVDEAYYEFCGKTVVDMTYDHENLIVLRTFSKAFGMAGMRVAYLVAHPKTVQLLNKVRPTNSLCVLSVKMAQDAFSHLTTINQFVSSIVQERKRLHSELERLELSPFPSETNFLLVRFNEYSAKSAYQGLLQRGLVTRDLNDVPLIENCLRITVQAKEANNLLLNSLKEIIKQ